MNFQGTGRILLWVAVAVLAVAAVGQGVRRMDKTDPVIIQSYAVPAEIASEVRVTLATVLSRGESEAPLGKVSMLPTGQLVVTAPASVQAGLRQILEEIREAKPAPTPAIRFDLWAVTATPGDSPQRSGDLAEIESAIDAISKTTGPMNFKLREKLSTVTRSGQHAQVAGTGIGMGITASLRKDEQDQPLVAADVNVSTLVSPSQRLAASAELRPGELFVIGQSAVADSRGGPEGQSSQIYYILRATL
jgi:hypothetical protein